MKPAIHLVVLFLLLLTGTATGQKKEKWVEIHGSSLTSFDFASSGYPGSQLPANYFRQALNLEVKIAGLPLGFSAFYSTGNQDNLQGMNALTLRFDYSRLLPALMYDSLSRFRKLQRSLRWIITLEAGDCHPVYSPLILTGINIKGVNVAINPGPVYAAFVYGLANRGLSDFGPWDEPYRRSLWMAKAGFGKTERSHFYISVMHAWDQPDSLKETAFAFPRPADTLVSGTDTIVIPGDTARMKITPAENWIAGTELALTFCKKKIRFEAEAGGSFYTPDRGAPVLEADNDAVKVVRFLDPRAGSHADWAIRSTLSADLGIIKFNGTYCYTGPGYESMGSPYLRKNMQAAESRITLKILKNRLTLNLSGKYIRRDPEQFDDRKFISLHGVLNVSYRLKQGPWFTIQFLPSWQYNRSDSIRLDYTSYITGFTGGYPWRIGTANSNTSISITYLESQINRSGQNDQVTTWSIGVNQSVSLVKYLSSRIFFSLTRSDGSMSQSNRCTGGIDLRSSPRKWISAMVGLNFTTSKSLKRIFTLNGSIALKPWQWLSFDVLVSRNTGSINMVAGSLPEWTGRASVSVMF
jgi:hypothetical protein